LQGKRIGVIEGSLPYQFFSDNQPQVTLVIVENAIDGTRRLLRGEFDALAANAWSELYLLKELNISGIVGLAPFSEGKGNIAVRKGDEVLRSEIDRALTQLQASGEFDQIIDRWSSSKVHLFSDSVVKTAWIAGIVAVLSLVLLSMSWVVLYRKQGALRRAEAKLKLAAMVYQVSSEAMMLTDEDNRIISVNAAFERITGYGADEVTGRAAGFLRSSRDSKFRYREMLGQLARHRHWKGELWLQKKSQESFAAAVTINTTIAPEGAVSRHVILFSDITEKKCADQLIWQQANFDTLTGLPNSSMFQDDLRRELAKASRNGQPLALMFLDLDGFKHVNDSLGHDMGDELLREAAARLRHCVRALDFVARLGGDEFTVILSDLHGLSSVARVAQKILRVLAEPYRLREQFVHVSASIGITLFPQDADSIDDLITNADQAMYAAKQGGRNRYSYFTPSMQEAAQVRTRTISDLRAALDGEQFFIHYQPIVELSSGEIHKAEALIRWQHPTRGVIKPDQFIATAEDIGLIAEFGDWMFRKAATQAARWRQAYFPDFQVSVNISPVQFRDGGIDVVAWLDHLQALDLPGKGIAAEITEGLLLDAGRSVTDKLLTFRDAGIEVALDDFGTGYSALSYLKKFDIDYIKIDQSFVSNLTVDSDDLALCEAIIVMAHKLGVKVIAEGIETGEQCDLLTAAGCDYGQGYFFSRPVSAEKFEETLAGNTAGCCVTGRGV